MKIKMILKSDAIFGNGYSVPGGEDISVLSDKYGFPYYKGATLKGIFREELCNLLAWKGYSEEDINNEVIRLLGKSGSSDEDLCKIRFSDLTLSEKVRSLIRKENLISQDVLDSFSYIRTFTANNADGTAEKGSLRSARCLKEGLIFYGEITCNSDDENIVKEVLSLIKWIGTMRNRGFGNTVIRGEG